LFLGKQMSVIDSFLVWDGSSCPLPLLSTGTLSGLNLWIPCSSCYSLCEFKFASVLLCLEGTFCLESSFLSGSFFSFLFFYWMFSLFTFQMLSPLLVSSLQTPIPSPHPCFYEGALHPPKPSLLSVLTFSHTGTSKPSQDQWSLLPLMPDKAVLCYISG